jgi:hypothetical protein
VRVKHHVSAHNSPKISSGLTEVIHSEALPIASAIVQHQHRQALHQWIMPRVSSGNEEKSEMEMLYVYDTVRLAFRELTEVTDLDRNN